MFEQNITTFNASMSGSALTTLSTQMPVIGTVLGVGLVLSVIIGALIAAHSWNKKGWLFKLYNWIMANIGENFIFGATTIFICGSIWYIGNELSKFGESNPHLLTDVLWFSFLGIAGIIGVAIIGYITKPIYTWAYDYATAKKK